jgi:MFS family permease
MRANPKAVAGWVTLPSSEDKHLASALPKGTQVGAPTASTQGWNEPDLRSSGRYPVPGPPTGRQRDFRLLWASQSITVLGDQFLVLALPLFAVAVLGATAAEAALIPFALFAPYLLVGLPAGAIVDRLPRRTTMMACDAIQTAVFGIVAMLAWVGGLSFPLLIALVMVAGSAAVFYQVAYSSYLPELFAGTDDIHRGNSRLFLSESLAKTLGPLLAGPAIGVLGVVSAIAVNAASFAASLVATFAIRHREDARTGPPASGGWLLSDVKEGVRFVLAHPLLEPVISCGAVYVFFLSALNASLVLYCRDVLMLDPVMIGVVVGASAAGFPVGNLLSGRFMARVGISQMLALGAVVSVTGLVLMPIAGSLGSVGGLVAGSIVHGVGEGSFGPTSLTLRQTATPSDLLGRVNSIQRFLIWGMVPVGSLMAFGVIGIAGLEATVWVGAVGTAWCLPLLARRGIANDLGIGRLVR